MRKIILCTIGRQRRHQHPSTSPVIVQVPGGFRAYRDYPYSHAWATQPTIELAIADLDKIIS